MKLLMLSIDRKIFDPNSGVAKRMKEFGALADRIDIVIYTPKGFSTAKVSENVTAYPTNSRFKILYFWDAFRISSRIIKKEKTTLVTSQEAMTNIAGIFLKKFFNIPLEVQIHTDFASSYFRKESFKNYLRYWGYRLGVRYGTCVRVVSARIAKSISVVPRILPVFTSVERFKNGNVPSIRDRYPFTFIALVISRFEREKNVALAIRALAEVVQSHKDVGLIIVGEGSEREKLISLSRSLGVQKNIVFEKWTDTPEIYYHSADVFINTSNYEGYGCTVIEAAASGVPIISTDVGLMGDMFTTESAIVVPILDYQALSRAIISAKQLPQLRSTLALRARKAIENISDKDTYLKLMKESWERC